MMGSHSPALRWLTPEWRTNCKTTLIRMVRRSGSAKPKGTTIPEPLSPTQSSPRIGSCWEEEANATQGATRELGFQKVTDEENHTRVEPTCQKALATATGEIGGTSDATIHSVEAKNGEQTAGCDEVCASVVSQQAITSIEASKTDPSTAATETSKPLPGFSPLRPKGSVKPASEACLRVPTSLPPVALNEGKKAGNAVLRPPPGFLPKQRKCGRHGPSMAVCKAEAAIEPSVDATAPASGATDNQASPVALETGNQQSTEVYEELRFGADTFSRRFGLLFGRYNARKAVEEELKNMKAQSEHASTTCLREKSASQDGATLRKESDMHHTLRQRFVNLLHLAVSPTRAGDYDIEALVQEKDVFITPRPLSERCTSYHPGFVHEAHATAPTTSTSSSLRPWFTGRTMAPFKPCRAQSCFLEDQPWYLKAIKTRNAPVTDPVLNPFAEPVDWDLQFTNCVPCPESGAFLQWAQSEPSRAAVSQQTSVLIAGMSAAPRPFASD